MKKLWYERPAENFTEALPLGNGRLGAMVYADPFDDKLSLNEDTLWSGFPMDKSPENAFDGICRAKELINDHKYSEAENVLWKNSLGGWTESYQPAGSLIIKCSDTGQVTDYYRELDLEDAVAKSTYSIGGHKYSKEVFCSHKSELLAYHFSTDFAGSESAVSLSSPHPFKNVSKSGQLIIKSTAPYYAAPSYFECEDPIRYDSFENNRALTYSIAVRPVLLNGSCTIEKDCIKIKSSDFYLLLDICTDFEGFDKQPVDSKIDTEAKVEEKLSQVDKDYPQLKAEHIEDYKSLFDRVELEISGKDRSDLPTDKRLTEYEKDNSDTALMVLLFDYGRYLTIAASRENTQAMNLQGIWNEELRAPWSSNYTLNINAEMNYWHVERSNLSECHLPLIDLTEELSQNCRKTARENYHCEGWCSHHNSDIWRQSEPVGGENRDVLSVGYGFWNMSGAWLSRHIWQHYEFTNDVEFLKKYWNVIKGAAEFLASWLVENENGKLVTPIATSPENRYYLEDGSITSVSKGCAMDIGMTYDIFDICIKVCEILKCDFEFSDKLKSMLNKLQYYTVGSKGQIIEWDVERPELEPHHRHLSFLYGVYPGNLINDKTPEWKSAAEKSMDLRGDVSTGWGLCWKINVWARLGKAERAKKCADKMMRLVRESGYNYNDGGGLYANLMDAHPPFQIDGNFGFVAGILEMLLQTNNGEVRLLPALPDDWARGGRVKGLRLEGNKTIDFEWKDGKITHQNIT